MVAAAHYLEEFGEELTEGMFYDFLNDEFNDAMELAENFAETLIYHNVTVESGYYMGFQFIVTEKYERQFDLDRDSEYCIDNDDAHYYFDLCRSKAIRAADAEKRRIVRWLENLKGNGYVELVCSARFSNGEAWYRQVS